MKGYLLDTSVALFAVGAPERLRKPVRSAIDRGPVRLSVISYWEVMVKSMKGNLNVGDPRQWWSETIEALDVIPLSLLPEHVAGIYDLPPLHQDPFDRALIAQAAAEDLVLLTADASVRRYAGERLRVIC